MYVCSPSLVQFFATPWLVASLPGSSVHGISQAILEWVVISSSKGIFPTQGWNSSPQSPEVAGWSFTTGPPENMVGKTCYEAGPLVSIFSTQYLYNLRFVTEPVLAYYLTSKCQYYLTSLSQNHLTSINQIVLSGFQVKDPHYSHTHLISPSNHGLGTSVSKLGEFQFLNWTFTSPRE